MVMNVKSKKKKAQFQIADTLFEMGLDFDIIEKISGVTPSEILMNKINLIEFEEEKKKE